MKRSRSLIPLVAALALALTLAACGSDEPSSSDATAAPGASAESEGSYEIVSDAEVATGIATSESDMQALATAGKATEEQVDELFEGWEGYEGTVKQNDPDTYLALEDALGAFKKAAAGSDQAGMTKALGDFTTAASAYLADHPAA